MKTRFTHLQKAIPVFCCLLTLSFTTQGLQSQSLPIWTDNALSVEQAAQVEATSFRALELDESALRTLLKDAPLQLIDMPHQSGVVLSLPLPNGETTDFRIVETSTMSAALQSRFPSIRSYRGVGVDNPLHQLHCDMSPNGFHAMIFNEGSTVYIDPLRESAPSNKHISYTREAFFQGTSKTWEGCQALAVGEKVPTSTLQNQGTENVPIPMGSQRFPAPLLPQETDNGDELRTYRLALACTGEYAQFHGGTVTSVLAAMNTSMVRVNGVFERDVAIRMVIVDNNDQLVFLNASTDPYTNNDGGTMLGQNINTCNSVIGSANYDIGHVFSTGGGGVAYLQSPCGSSKAGGVTGQGSPVGDPFDIDYVCHEIGHQFGGNHTQNNSCNRSTGAAYEPGSASTIMGYAGICSPNLQSNSDDHFHNHSCNEMIAFSVNGNGNSCAAVTSTANTPPTVDAGTNGLVIPASTPFELTATGSDPDGGAITFNWEEYDLGPATASGDNDLTNPSGNQPIFRSWPSTTSPKRIFPRVNDLVNGTVTIGEHLPTYSRDLNFKCTVRDNELNGGGFADDLLTMSVDGSSGPFLVSAPNGGEAIAAGIPTIISWDVAGTNAGAVNCASIDIFLSTDGGYTWPYTLISNASNNGTASVTLPNIPTANARIKIKGASHVFFDISNGNFTIEEASNPVPYDAMVNNIIGVNPETCGTAIAPSVEIINVGTETLTAFDVAFDLDNGQNTTTIGWSGSLAPGAMTVVELCNANDLCLEVEAGEHTLDVSVSLIGQTDEVAANNANAISFASGCFESCSNCGCTDPTACNYDTDASIDDGSCIFQEPCSCQLTGNQSASLSGNETGEPLTQSATSLAPLTTITIELDFDNAGSSGSWPADLAMAITPPSGECISFGGYNGSPDGCPSIGNYQVVWPAGWQTQAAGLYTATVDISEANLSGSGDWSVTLYNGYGASSEVNYVVNWIIEDLCLDVVAMNGCTDATACNYDENATDDDGSCFFAEEGYNCAGECILDTDGDGEPDCDAVTCPADLNGNGSIEVSDVLILLSDFGCTTECIADIDGDGATNVNDVLLLLAAFGDDC